MQPVINTSTFIFLITVVLCFVTGPVLLIFSKSKTVDNRWLAGYYIAAGYGFFVAFLLYSKLINNFPWYNTYRTGYIAAFLLMPLSFIYTRSLIQQKKFRPADLIHFLPVTIFIIDFIPYYLQPESYKLHQLSVDEQQLNTVWGQFSQGWLGIGMLYVPVRIALAMFYWVLQVRMIFRSGKLKAGNNLVSENKAVIIWAKIFCALQVFYFLPYYLDLILGSKDELFFVQHTMAAVGVSITILILVLKPDILYGLKGVVIRDLKNNSESYEIAPAVYPGAVTGNNSDELKLSLIEIPSQSSGGPASEDIYLSGERLTDLGERVATYVLAAHPYLKKGCTCAALASEMHMQPYVLSAIINQVFKTNFNDFINNYRVEHAKSLIQNGEAKLLTLEALSEQSGFNNRNSFTIAFKKHTGQTPSAFIKQAAMV